MKLDLARFQNNRYLKGMTGWLALFWIMTAINPLNRFDWLLENILVFIYGLLLVITYRKFQFSNLSYGLLTLFLTLHLTGAHYTYSEVPLGFWLQDFLHLERNHFDRCVHFSFGLLIVYPFRELLIRCSGIYRTWSYFLAVTVILAFSGFFEVIEAGVAMVVSPELGTAYLGTQGDVWDSQWDTFMAFLGATFAMLITYAKERSKHANNEI